MLASENLKKLQGDDNNHVNTMTLVIKELDDFLILYIRSLKLGILTGNKSQSGIHLLKTVELGAKLKVYPGLVVAWPVMLVCRF
jgi:hypothetical protein